MTTIRHPSRFVWDFWYLWDEDARHFHVLYLNAAPESAKNSQHHFEARLGYARTRDFLTADWIDDDVFRADEHGWDNSSIWSGDVISIQRGYLLYYTSRDRRRDDGLTQTIGAAFSTDFRNWSRVDGFRLDADSRFYSLRTSKDDDSIHAWRDPFLFRHRGRAHMVLAAKVPDAPAGRRGAVALLRSVDDDPFRWETLPPLAAPGWYSEMEVPQLYKDGADQLTLVYSCWAKFDHAPGTQGQGGLQAMAVSLDKPERSQPYALTPESTGLYASRVVPELDGDIVGFNIEAGGWRRAHQPTGFQHVDRDFSTWRVGAGV